MAWERLSRTYFNLIHKNNLVYNTCWEDPRLDHVALELGPDDNVLVITSAGCNALDYALAGPNRVYAVDMNPRQNALLELKLAGIRNLDYDTFFELFGRGSSPQWATIYHERLRNTLSPDARSYWDRRSKFFDGSTRRSSFYFWGSSGTFAWLVNGYINRVAKIRDGIDTLLNASTVEEQQEIYREQQLRESLFRPMITWMLRRDATLAMLGVPRSQRRQLDEGYPGGVVQFIVDRIETVFAGRPLHDNYFWRVYLTGSYTPECCPEYLKPDNFQKLKDGLVDRVEVHTNSILGFLDENDVAVSRFVLLDHMDWLWANLRDVLSAEWQAIHDRAADNTRIIWRSAGLEVDFVDPITINGKHGQTQLGDLLKYNTELASELHERDRVNTYGSFYIADLTA
ncbi:BtaA family protein [Maioricimonas sp. JC845]|uniref:DUF3419 family protein n=1 Tax=Maioricimonas sp. JC845 TaxID=3232138 RepID=UPI0034576F9B